MPERSTISQVVQIGAEATPGTGVAANKRMSAMGIEPSPQFEISQFRPAGNKWQTLAVLGKEWVEAAVTGRATYTELIYALNSIVTKVTPTVTGTTGQKWTFSPNATSEDTPQTYTVEHGSAVRAAKFTNGLFTELSLTFNRESIELNGSMLGRALTDGITLTPAPTGISLVPIVPTQVDVYLDPTSAALGTTKLARLLSCEWSLSDRFGPLWIVDSSQPSFVTQVETEPTLQATIMVEADAAGMALLTTLRNGTTNFLRIKATGGVIGAGPATYSLIIDMAVKIVDSGGYSDEDGVFAIEWTLGGVYDSGWGKAFTIDVINDLTTL